jgi:lysine 2,3-aminomutase
MLTTADELAAVISLAPEERAGLAAAASLFRTGITPYYASLMDPTHASCPIRMQAIPRVAEAEVRAEELRDPLGEDTHRPAPAVVHKYPDRVLLLVVDRCGIYCRHCNRRRLVGGDDPPTAADVDRGIEYIARTPRVRDVLLSGGDPLLLSTRRLGGLPVGCPWRIDDELCAELRRHHPLFVNTHFNHPVELTAEAREACARLVDAGIPVGNQTVLLRGVNSSVRALRALMRGLLRARVRPYYLFQGDTVIGTDHLRTPVEDALRLYAGLRGWINGMAVPQLVLDAPGGGGKVPINPDYILQRNASRVVLRNFEGRVFEYPEARDGTPLFKPSEDFHAPELV